MMKKFINIAFMLLVIASAAVAQEVNTTITTTVSGETPALTSKRGFPILPEAGEWGLGVAANPFLNYLGNFVNGNTNNTTNINRAGFTYASNPGNNFALYGKLMIDQNTAYRVRFNVGVGTDINKAAVEQNLINGNPDYPAFTEDWQKVSATNILLAPGYEFRRGKTRLQGVYGGELVLGFNKTNVEYQYGNPISASFPTADGNRTDFGPTAGVVTSNFIGTPVSGYVTEAKSGSNFLVGARGFIGVEFFFAPKMSIGGEFGYMLAYQTQGKGKLTYETWDGGLNQIRTTETDVYENGTNRDSSFGIALDNLDASINLLFYF